MTKFKKLARVSLTLSALTVSAIAMIPQSAMAWGPNGHRVTGKIADEYVAEDTRTAITAILGVESLAEASTWPDFMRSDPSDFWRNEAGPWHYVTVPEGETYATAQKPTDRDGKPVGDAFTALQKFTVVLKDPTATLPERQLALRFVIHIVADLHQPLHAGNGKDRGGNRFTVLFMDQETNLHSVWDEEMLAEEKLSYTEKARWLQRRITDADRQQWIDIDPQIWIAESTSLRDRIYPIDPNNPPNPDYPTIPNLSYNYIFKHKGDMDLRLQQGGVRLAAYLDSVFAK